MPTTQEVDELYAKAREIASYNLMRWGSGQSRFPTSEFEVLKWGIDTLSIECPDCGIPIYKHEVLCD